MKDTILRPFLSPNTNGQKIQVEFLILHYTACSLTQALKIFKDPLKKVSCHLIIDTNGDIYEIIPSLESPPIKAFHAGKSLWQDENKKWEDFNCFSLGIELVNNNGNLFPYTQAQYHSLVQLTKALQKKYPALKNPHRVLGHEHIAGFRGKVDPGLEFQWDQYFSRTYSCTLPKRKPALILDIKDRFEDLIKNLAESEHNWSELNSLLEQHQKHYLDTQTN